MANVSERLLESGLLPEEDPREKCEEPCRGTCRLAELTYLALGHSDWRADSAGWSADQAYKEMVEWTPMVGSLDEVRR